MMNAFLRTLSVYVVLTAILAVAGMAIDLVFGFHRTFLYILIAIALISSFATFWWSKPMALAGNRAHIITREEEPRLYRIVEKVANEAGLPMPEVGISEYDMPNAFATGRSPSNAAVVATRGLLRLLNDDELEGVIGHEMSHVKNRDIMVMSATSAVVSILTYVGQFAAFGNAANDRENNGAAIVLVILCYILLPIAGLLLQMAVSRSREYLADETGARITGKPLALANALRKLEAGIYRTNEEYDDRAHANMWISEPLKADSGFLSDIFATHPSTDKRIARLEQIAKQMQSGEIPKYEPDEKYGNHSGLSID